MTSTGDLFVRTTHLVLATVALVLPARAGAQSVNYEMVPVNDAGNSVDTTGYGAVPYAYLMGKYEVTIGQYAAFLNAVAKTDPRGLFNSSMETNENSSGIARTGSSGSYVYAVIGPFGDVQIPQATAGNRPITFVSWFDSARFANWMSNGQPTGAQGPATTEDGAYPLYGATSGTAPAINATNPNTGAVPMYRIPTENEWYKAAYYKSGGPNAGYWAYATQSNLAPSNVLGSGANLANFCVRVGGTPFYSVTQASTLPGNQNFLTDVGSFSGSVSAYGTFDQCGNVFEWNDLDGSSGTIRGRRGGSWLNNEFQLSALGRSESGAAGVTYSHGFRLSSPPVPQRVMIQVSSGIQTQGQAGYSSVTPYFAASVTKTGSGTLVLDAVNTYTGLTSVTAGALALSGSGSIASSSTVQITSDAVFNVSAKAGGYTVPSGQTLSGAGTVLGSVTFGRGSTLSPGMPGEAGSFGALQVASVPEPGAWGTAATGLACGALVASRRRRRRQGVGLSRCSISAGP